MRLPCTVLLIFCLLVPAVQSQTKSELESDSKGWTDLLADKTMKDWIRFPLNAAGKLRAGSLDDPTPWKLEGGVLSCAGDKVGHEFLRYAPELADFVIHAEWRHVKTEGITAYNGGLYVRTAPDESIWHQAQTTPGGGYLLGKTLVNGAPAQVNFRKNMPENRTKEDGEWNVFEVRAVGKQMTLWVNGAIVNEWNECEVPKGYICLEAEGGALEWRNILLKPLP
jgi:hypothetical protein